MRMTISDKINPIDNKTEQSKARNDLPKKDFLEKLLQ